MITRIAPSLRSPASIFLLCLLSAVPCLVASASLEPFLGESNTGRDILIEQGGPIAVRQRNWKLISTGKAPGNKKKVVLEDKDRAPRDTGASRSFQLFNLADDLADQQPDKTNELAEILHQVRVTGRTC